MQLESNVPSKSGAVYGADVVTELGNTLPSALDPYAQSKPRTFGMKAATGCIPGTGLLWPGKLARAKLPSNRTRGTSRILREPLVCIENYRTSPVLCLRVVWETS